MLLCEAIGALREAGLTGVVENDEGWLPCWPAQGATISVEGRRGEIFSDHIFIVCHCCSFLIY